MIRLITYFVAFAAFVTAIVWLNDNPGIVEFNWFNYHIKSSIGLFIAAIIILVFVSVILWRLAHSILGAPDAFGLFFSSRRRRKGYEALSKGIIAVGTGDAKAARKFARIADEKLDQEPLTLLLQAQTAQLEGNKQLAHKAFEKMADKTATKMLGLRGLFVEAQRNDDGGAAKLIALDAVAADDQSKWALNGLFDLQTNEGDWAGALNSLLMLGRLPMAKQADIKRKRAVLQTAEAQRLADGQAERALELTLEARNNAPDLVPATLLAAQLLLNKGSVRKAHKLLERCWRLAPHPELGALFALSRDLEKPKARLKRVQIFAEKAGVGNVAVKHQAAVEAGVVVARVAIEQQDWTVARNALGSIVADDPSARVCTLMAKIEQGELGNKGLVAEWLARAQKAPADPMWLADGHIAVTWLPVSALSGELDAYEWKMPDYNLAQVEADLAVNILLEHQVNEFETFEAQEKIIVEAKSSAKLAQKSAQQAVAIAAEQVKESQQKLVVAQEVEAKAVSVAMKPAVEKAINIEKAEKADDKIALIADAEFQPADASPQKSGDAKSAGLQNGNQQALSVKKPINAQKSVSVEKSGDKPKKPAKVAPKDRAKKASGAKVVGRKTSSKTAVKKSVGNNGPYRSRPAIKVKAGGKEIIMPRRPDDPGPLDENDNADF
ncbi:MAG: hypothetical protein HRU29_12220 [Rhizobiales bacterium]|nr:hypothetical protein [Hyphomicrobiales bacterium]NRB15154.1 hypothetical protein [Hyphomicrobiales bacterium]